MQIETAIHGSKGQITTIISIMFAKSYTYYQLTTCAHDFFIFRSSVKITLPAIILLILDVALNVRLLYFYVKLSKIIVLLCQFFFLKKKIESEEKTNNGCQSNLQND